MRADALVDRLRGRRLIVASNREPVVHRRTPAGIETLTPASGLTTAMLPLVAGTDGTWVAHGSGDADFLVTDAHDRVTVHPEGSVGGSFRLRRVRLPADVERGYYYGYANEGLWPLCHVAYTAPVFRKADWEHYVRANRLFADAILAEVSDAPAVVLLNDFHLALVARMLRDARPDLLIAQFWHVPWPSRETMRVCPQLAELLDGLLGNDLFGLHIRHHCNNFLETVDRGIEALVDHERLSAQRHGHRTYVRPFPISIEVDAFTEDASARTFEATFPELAARVGDRTMLLGVDRLDYTKGIPHRLRMLERMLELAPELCERVVLVQVGAPTRSVIPRYRALAAEVDDLQASINARFGTREWQPIEYLPDHHDRRDVAVLMRRADGCLVTPLHDGMNLVAKEYVAARAGLPGVLVLSKFAGSARELPEACLINPYDIDGSAELLLASLRLEPARLQDAMERMLAHLRSADVHRWASDLLSELDAAARFRDAVEFPGN
ncbi:MAG: trehalose-6-phosphate synthase [Deltaproteobacteria bacterium]|nr:trehalose-6-phosphate synthase [Deltaproteobacteria bacterium]